MLCKHHGELEEKDIRTYIRNRRGRSELTTQCKLCHKETASRARDANRERSNEWARQDRLKNPEKYRLQAQKYREKAGPIRNIMEISRLRGITTEQYLNMLEKQNYKCAICKNSESRQDRKEGGSIAQLCLDHNHTTGKVREFLCHNCNTMIGFFKEDISRIESAIKYLIEAKKSCQK